MRGKRLDKRQEKRAKSRQLEKDPNNPMRLLKPPKPPEAEEARAQ